jgi:hypothetical protein
MTGSNHRFVPTARPLAPKAAGSCSTDFRRTCPNCGAELWDKECKSRCPRCHFFTDCSDPW